MGTVWELMGQSPCGSHLNAERGLGNYWGNPSSEGPRGRKSLNPGFLYLVALIQHGGVVSRHLGELTQPPLASRRADPSHTQ